MFEIRIWPKDYSLKTEERIPSFDSAIGTSSDFLEKKSEDAVKPSKKYNFYWTRFK